MIAESLSLFTVPELVTQFRNDVMRVGSAWNLGKNPERFEQTPERAALVSQIRALAAELRARAPVNVVTSLIEDGDIDVRAWAFRQFFSVAPGLARANRMGLGQGLSAQQVLELIKRARSKPPKRPTLNDMTIDRLVARFVDACQRHYGARFAEADDWPDDLSLSNRISGELVTIMQEFKRRDALDHLLPFLDSDNVTERSMAAQATITIAPERAIKTLEAVVESKDSYEFSRPTAPWRTIAAARPWFTGSVEFFAASVAGRGEAGSLSPEAACKKRGSARPATGGSVLSLRQNRPLQITQIVTCAMKFWARRGVVVI